MTHQSILALIASSSGSLQNGLLALMTTLPQISAVLVAEDAGSALRMAENHQPALVILDMALPKAQDVIEQIKAQWAHLHLIVLAEDVAQQKEGEASGADSVLLKGFPPAKLVASIEGLLAQRENHSRIESGSKDEPRAKSGGGACDD